ncbi:MAG: VOC family protein [Gemmatimonadaceae bacterium]
MTQPGAHSASRDAATASPPGTGRFVWHDLMTSDVAKSLAFYKQLVGWTSRDVAMGEMGTYTMIAVDGRDIGGVTPQLREAASPPHWLGYVTVDSVDAAVAVAKERGGTVHVPPTDIPDVGRFAVIADPAGAVTAPFTFSDDGPPETDAMPAGTVAWNELITTDPVAAVNFYTAVYGWTVETMRMEMGEYSIFKRGDVKAAGMLQMPPGAQGPPAWLTYIVVDDVDASTENVTKLGGRAHVQPTDIEGVGRFSVVSDPVGAMFALFKGGAE